MTEIKMRESYTISNSEGWYYEVAPHVESDDWITINQRHVDGALACGLSFMKSEASLIASAIIKLLEE